MIARTLGFVLGLVLGMSEGVVYGEAPHEKLVEVTSENVPGVVMDIRYGTDRNISGQRIYPDCRGWLRQETIQKLAKVAITDCP